MSLLPQAVKRNKPEYNTRNSVWWVYRPCTGVSDRVGRFQLKCWLWYPKWGFFAKLQVVSFYN